MNNNFVNRDSLKMISLLIAGMVAMWGMFVMGWCAMWRIYIDVPMLLVLSNIVTGIVSCITTVLVGRTIAQLNQGDSETTMRQTTETVTTPTKTVDPAIPQKVIVDNKPNQPVPVDSQPEKT